MLAYRLNKLGKTLESVKLLSKLDDCQWKISMMYLMKGYIYKVGKDTERTEEYSSILELWSEMITQLEDSLVNKSWIEYLHEYLDL